MSLLSSAVNAAVEVKRPQVEEELDLLRKVSEDTLKSCVELRERLGHVLRDSLPIETIETPHPDNNLPDIPRVPLAQRINGIKDLVTEAHGVLRLIHTTIEI